MFNVPTNTLSLAQGTYTAVACGKLTEGIMTYYLPVYNDENYPARFTFVVGGVESYAQEVRGLSVNSSGSWTNTLSVNGNTYSDIYVMARLYNQTGRSVTLNVRDHRFYLSTEIETIDPVVDAQGSHTFTRTQSSPLVTPTNDPTIADGGYVEMVFKITNIWSGSATSSPSIIESGRLQITSSLQFVSGGTSVDFPLYGLTLLMTVTHAN